MNPYKVLGVKDNATQVEIKDRYRELSKQYHPDKPTGDAGKFKEIAAAYEILGDLDRRKAFDEFGTLSTDDQLERKAAALVQQIFHTLIAQKGLAGILSTDVIASMNDLLDQGVAELDGKKGTAESNIIAVNKILDKFTFKNKDNPIHAMLINDIAKHDATILQVNNELSIAKKTFELLKDYKFDADEGQIMHAAFGPGNYTVNFGTGTGGM